MNELMFLCPVFTSLIRLSSFFCRPPPPSFWSIFPSLLPPLLVVMNISTQPLTHLFQLRIIHLPFFLAFLPPLSSFSYPNSSQRCRGTHCPRFVFRFSREDDGGAVFFSSKASELVRVAQWWSWEGVGADGGGGARWMSRGRGSHVSCWRCKLPQRMDVDFRHGLSRE